VNDSANKFIAIDEQDVWFVDEEILLLLSKLKELFTPICTLNTLVCVYIRWSGWRLFH